jgi:hypothetical protein
MNLFLNYPILSINRSSLSSTPVEQNIPGKLIQHARQLILKIPVQFYEEVQMLKSGLRFNPTEPAFASGFT